MAEVYPGAEANVARDGREIDARCLEQGAAALLKRTLPPCAGVHD